MKNLWLLVFLFALNTLNAQTYLPGLWKGSRNWVMTKGGIEAKDGYTFELFLELEGSYLKGRSYVHLNETEVIEMQVKRTAQYGSLAQFIRY